MENIKYYSDELERSLLLLDKEAAEKLLKEASAKGSAIEVASQIITATFKKIGDDWEDGSVALSQIYMSGVICEELIDKILPPNSAVRINQPKMAIGCIDSDKSELVGNRNQIYSRGWFHLDKGPQI